MPINPPFLGMVGAAGAGTQPVTGNAGSGILNPGTAYQFTPGLMAGINRTTPAQGGGPENMNPFPPGTPQWMQWEEQHKQAGDQYNKIMRPPMMPGPGQV